MGDIRTIAVIVAGGKGTRMASDRKKQYLELDGTPVLIHTLSTFDRHPGTEAMILVVPGPDLDFCTTLVASHGIKTPVQITAGGKERQDSVENGLHLAADLSEDPGKTIVMVHDGVRPFVTHGVMDACLGEAKRMGAAIPALKVSDTIKMADDEGKIVKTLDRRMLYRAQTPQTFRLDLGLSAFAHAVKTGFRGTDEASILEYSGIPVSIVPGAETNIKLTTPQDLGMARSLVNL